MLIDRHALARLQAAFDHATEAYKARVGDRTAWSDFYDSVHHGLNALSKPSRPFGASYEYAEAVGVRALELRLEVLAEYPELLALTRQELNITLGYAFAPASSRPLIQHGHPATTTDAVPLQNRYDRLDVAESSSAAQEADQALRAALETCTEWPPPQPAPTCVGLHG